MKIILIIKDHAWFDLLNEKVCVIFKDQDNLSIVGDMSSPVPDQCVHNAVKWDPGLR